MDLQEKRTNGVKLRKRTKTIVFCINVDDAERMRMSPSYCYKYAVELYNKQDDNKMISRT